MTVQEYDRVDQIAVGRDGRLLLAMTENRRYGQSVDAEMAEDFRLKLNTYLSAVRFGGVHRMAREASVSADKGIEIVLFSRAEPSSTVIEMIEVVNSTLEKEGITARWELLASHDIGPEVYERAIVDEVLGIVSSDCKFVVLWIAVVGAEGVGGLQVVRADGSVENLQLTGTLQELLLEYKRATYDPRTGAWLSGQIKIASPDRYRVEFSWDSLPEWVSALGAEDFRQELASYTRHVDKIPGWIPMQVSGDSTLG